MITQQWAQAKMIIFLFFIFWENLIIIIFWVSTSDCQHPNWNANASTKRKNLIVSKSKKFVESKLIRRGFKEAGVNDSYECHSSLSTSSHVVRSAVNDRRVATVINFQTDAKFIFWCWDLAAADGTTP